MINFSRFYWEKVTGHLKHTAIHLSNGTIKQAEIFIAVLGASNFTYAEATWSQKLHDWISSHVRCFEYIDGVTKILVPDNLKSAVSKANKYDPDINPSYQQMAIYYNTTIIPARSHKPKDKAKVESGVLIVERWILAKLRNVKFHSLGELNIAIKKLLKELNNKPFQKLPGNRYSSFIELDKPNLKPLPKKSYEFTEIKKATVHVDYHVEIEQHYYSVPYNLVRKKVEIHITSKTISILYKGTRVASHARSFNKGYKSTQFNHMPTNHQKFKEWSSGKSLDWALKIGPSTTQIVKDFFEKRLCPIQNYKFYSGLSSLSKKYSESRLENACKRALVIDSSTYKSIASILENGLDQLPISEQDANFITTSDHENVRGANYYQ